MQFYFVSSEEINDVRRQMPDVPHLGRVDDTTPEAISDDEFSSMHSELPAHPRGTKRDRSNEGSDIDADRRDVGRLDTEVAAGTDDSDIATTVTYDTDDETDRVWWHHVNSMMSPPDGCCEPSQYPDYHVTTHSDEITQLHYHSRHVIPDTSLDEETFVGLSFDAVVANALLDVERPVNLMSCIRSTTTAMACDRRPLLNVTCQP